jgi:hypothetical protein
MEPDSAIHFEERPTVGRPDADQTQPAFVPRSLGNRVRKGRDMGQPETAPKVQDCGQA